MPTVTPRYTDKEARVILPSRFANSAVLVEEVSETELRIRIAAEPGDDASFSEEHRALLADEDRDFLLDLLSAPPKASPVLKDAAAEHRRLHG